MTRRLDRLLTIEDLEQRANRRLPRMIADFLNGGAEDERTIDWNRRAFAETSFRPRVLVDVSERDLSTTVCGERLALPVVLAPTGLARLVHHEGEMAAARAATAAGSLLVVSSASSFPLESLSNAVDGPMWFQLYPWGDRGLTGGLIDRAERAGYRALCVTVDVPAVGGRERDIRNGFTVPPRVRPANVLDVARHPRWLLGLARGGRITLENLVGLPGGPGDDALSLARYINEELLNPANDWEELAWIRERWSRPLLVKGVLTAEDARRAVAHGVDGIVISNHGGRQLDGAPATLDVLPEILEATEGEIDVLIDGGIRRGSDVVKAIATGAKACLVGRPFWYGLACGGEDGVTRMFEILRTEIDRTLALIGCPRVDKLDPTYLRR